MASDYKMFPLNLLWGPSRPQTWPIQFTQVLFGQWNSCQGHMCQMSKGKFCKERGWDTKLLTWLHFLQISEPGKYSSHPYLYGQNCLTRRHFGWRGKWRCLENLLILFRTSQAASQPLLAPGGRGIYHEKNMAPASPSKFPAFWKSF